MGIESESKLLRRRNGRKKSCGVQNEYHFRGNVYERSEERIEKSKGRQADTDAVYNQSSDEVLHDGAVASPSDCQGLHQLSQIIADQDDVCAFARDICASTHRDAYSRFH